ncbi:transposase [Saccharopolyspora sp. NPDC050389]|uniref:IS110 family transposase n=1 Tax=Saccharopolyspora sp. NPDC050389 TaxID=3155516 RepID=UPI0033FC271B
MLVAGLTASPCFAVPHTEEGIVSALTRLARHGHPSELPVTIETTRGLVVDRLLASGHRVVPVHPNAFHAARPRWGAARAKNDPGDSFKLADYQRTDAHRPGCPCWCRPCPGRWNCRR